MKTMQKNWVFAAMLALVLIVACGCTTNTTPTPTTMPTVMTTPAPVATVEAATTMPAASPEAAAANMTITVDGKALTEKGMSKGGATWLPLEPVAKALGYTVTDNSIEENGAQRKSITLAKGDDTAGTVKVSYTIKENAVTDVSVTRGGTTMTTTAQITDPLMMDGDVLYASEKFFTDVLMAKVEVSGNAITVSMPSAAQPAA